MTADFHRVVRDFTHDLLRVFPERADTLDPLLQSIATDAENSAESATQVKAHCINVLPQRFFDILYQNNSIFEKKEDGTYGNTEFLPRLNFHELWNVEGVTDATKTTIWKYLQLIMFAVVEDVSNKESFGIISMLVDLSDIHIGCICSCSPSDRS